MLWSACRAWFEQHLDLCFLVGFDVLLGRIEYLAASFSVIDGAFLGDKHYVGIHVVVEVGAGAGVRLGLRIEVDRFVFTAKRSETLVVVEAGVGCRCRAWGSSASEVWRTL